MSAPFLDPAWFVTTLAPLKPATIADVQVLVNETRATTDLLLGALPGIAILPVGSDASGPDGLGNGRILTEQTDLLIQIYQRGGPDQTALADLRALRGAVYALLEGVRPGASWSPLRYQSGRPLAVNNATYSWIERYQTQTALRTA